jgi:cysteine desulfurase
MRTSIYLDHHATTPVDARVLEAMLPYFGPRFGNAASNSHSFGWEAAKAVEFARRRVAELAGAAPREIVFTSGATESDNLALKGVMDAYRAQGNHIVTMATEHEAVLDSVRRLEREGCRATVLAPEADGRLDLDRLRAAILPETVVVSVMYANNEIGVIQPVREIGAICREKRVLFHCDAVQVFGKVPVNVETGGIDLMSLTAHKMYGPKGVGALYVRRGVKVIPQVDGGGHESGMRSGTLNVPGIVGFGEACAVAAEVMGHEAARLAALRGRLLAALQAGVPDLRVNGSMDHRLAGNLNVSFPGVNGQLLLVNLPEVALSAAAACGSAAGASSHVLEAIGAGALAGSTLRFGLGRSTTEQEIDYAAGRVVEEVRKQRALAPA